MMSEEDRKLVGEARCIGPKEFTKIYELYDQADSDEARECIRRIASRLYGHINRIV